MFNITPLIAYWYIKEIERERETDTEKELKSEWERERERKSEGDREKERKNEYIDVCGYNF